MRKKIFVPLILIALVFVAWTRFNAPANHSFSNTASKDKLLMELITYFMQRGHFSPKIINNDLSEKLHTTFLEALDGQKRYFLKKDIIQFERYKYALDDEFRSLNTHFFDLVYARYLERKAEAELFYSELLEKPFDYSKNEEIDLNYEEQDYPLTLRQRTEKWRKQLKFSTLNIVHSKLEEEEKKVEKDASYTPKTFVELEVEARNITRENLENYFSLMGDLREEDWFGTYLNAFVSQFDPHSVYFAPVDKDRFDASMSGKYEGIGARLTKRNQAIKIVEIISGGPLWRDQSIEVGDQIMMVRQQEGDPVDVQSMRLDDAIELIKGPAGTTVFLTVKKVDGTVEEVAINRDTVVMEESYLKSTLIEKAGRSYGLIHLPKFYVDFKDYKERNAAKDMQQEIIRLKKQGMNGLVIDLRNNGGGSLQTVVDMAGFFIDEGPVVQVKSTSEKSKVLKDRDGKTLWEGPLVIMVNELSASASEILAAAMQDYERAVVLGSKQTFGKGTVQNVLELNRFVSKSTYGDLGALKYTTEKFYRITGKSTQLEGVKSDVVAPDRYAYVDIGEKDEENPLVWDQIASASFSKWNGYGNYQDVIQKSAVRIEKNELFQLIEKNAKWVKTQQDKNVFSLNYEAFSSEIEKDETVADTFEVLDDYTNSLSFSSLPYERSKMKSDTILAEKRKRWKKALNKDIYLEEAVHILEDLELNFIPSKPLALQQN
ncbi:MAG: carboxy terminal-processing peptidase [Flavobacteriaceae bacterium]